MNLKNMTIEQLQTQFYLLRESAARIAEDAEVIKSREQLNNERLAAVQKEWRKRWLNIERSAGNGASTNRGKV